MATPNLGFQNFFTTTLASGITNTDTTIYLNSLPTPSEGYLVIEPDSSTNKEIIYYTSKGANFVTLPSVAAGRGVGGTTAVSHSSGVTAQMNVVAEHFEALQDGTAFAVGGIGASAYADGWTPILGSTPNSVTYNGNRNYDLVFNSVDLSSTISPGQRLKLTRTVAAPTQCTDLESGSSQYYSKTSPAGLTFTTTWTAMAWVKLESYALGGIIARRNADTEGWSLAVNASGQLVATSLRIASNNSDTVSYASLPLNKWVHVAAATDLSGTTLMYIDGVLAPSATTVTGTAATLVQGTTALVVGARKSAGTDPFDGKIAQAAVFSTKLSAATIASYASQTLSGSETSLISAYSFNNSINDLNTTNANNLTANGSAVATNADSPYANAVTAGTEEYAEINSVSFSTNTTVNVRVPETCMIPTSGGISNVYYAVGSYPYGLPAFSNELVACFNKAGGSNISSGGNLNGFSITFTADGKSRYRLKLGNLVLGLYGGASTGITVYSQIKEGSTILSKAESMVNETGTGNASTVYAMTENFLPTAGSHTYTVILSSSNSQALSFSASSSSIAGAFFILEKA